ncbi:DUF5105 domain-containing protein [Bacillus haynesii]|uniref:DUF5105 domain-containing protein n=1 Tax=Bacillus haynesii TaxID=1925021 RepID=UPI0022823F47|nr:DUF5105 domain-containing protein [Bacillus haynesii]MCY7769309.1 DUF4352 domain-containing protein [Bacillus haynesii]MCY8002254.1 DUF4352 domain-containing protein [Bacillus haynesii]MCY8011759.1 DUF4352 domain-containing protein [Bacillus haynesii]MCY9215087.1 DUF4352 domain-containing protein [Bacillus haynesii]MEC0781833.1 DUF5105 domain-containing protein [Bacillus haynesii]
MRSKKMILMIVLVITAGLSAACSGGSQSGKGDTGETKQTAEATRDKDAEFKVLSSEYALPFEPSTTLDKDQLYLQIRVSIKNTGKKPFEVDPEYFNLYQDDVKVKNIEAEDKERLGYMSLNAGRSVEGNIYFLVDKGKKYQLSYTLDDIDTLKKIPFDVAEIDGNKIMDTADHLQDPAKALLGYTDVTIYGKDNPDFEKLTGENKRQVAEDYEASYRKKLISDLGYDYDTDAVDQKKLNEYIKAAQQTFREKTKVKAVTKSISYDEATIEATITRLDMSDFEDRVKESLDQFVKNSKKDELSKKELFNPTIDIMIKELKKLEQVSSKKTVKVTIQRTEDGKWQLNLQEGEGEEYFSSLIKSES